MLKVGQAKGLFAMLQKRNYDMERGKDVVITSSSLSNVSDAAELQGMGYKQGGLISNTQ